jgi:hypothetical protein
MGSEPQSIFFAKRSTFLSSVKDAKVFLAQIPKLQGFELQVTQGEPLKEDDPLPAGHIAVAPVVYVQCDHNRLPVPGYRGVSRLTVNKILETVFLMVEDLDRPYKSGCFLRRPNAEEALDGGTPVRNLDYRGPDTFPVLFGASFDDYTFHFGDCTKVVRFRSDLRLVAALDKVRKPGAKQDLVVIGDQYILNRGQPLDTSGSTHIRLVPGDPAEFVFKDWQRKKCLRQIPS